MSGKGFTLIELSIALVIIGLMVGAVLAGEDLRASAEVRATMTQIEKYNTAVNTFRTKFGALPGDLNSSTATSFGFCPRGSHAGQGNENGVIEGYDGAANNGFVQGGETLLFWQDLTVGNPAAPMNVNLIDGTFRLATTSSVAIAAGALSSYFPPARLGRNNYVYVYSNGGINYFGVAAIGSVSAAGVPFSDATMTIRAASRIDVKMDDGLPSTGNITASYVTDNQTGGNNGHQGSCGHQGSTCGHARGSHGNGSATTVLSDSNGDVTSSVDTSTCYDSALNVYALNVNDGRGGNCALSFRFQ